MIQIKRAYEASDKNDGYRVLIDRLWPRGVSKAKLKVEEWRKDFAPSTELRKWFSHDPKRWKTFSSRYKKELRSKAAQDWLNHLAELAKRRRLTLVYSAKDESHNDAVVLKQLLEKKVSQL